MILAAKRPFSSTSEAAAQAVRDRAEAIEDDTAEVDQLAGELDEEITKAGLRGNVLPAKPARRHRSVFTRGTWSAMTTVGMWVRHLSAPDEGPDRRCPVLPHHEFTLASIETRHAVHLLPESEDLIFITGDVSGVKRILHIDRRLYLQLDGLTKVDLPKICWPGQANVTPSSPAPAPHVPSPG